MRWSKLLRLVAPAFGRRGRPAAIWLLTFTTAILLASALLLYSTPEEKRISIYSNAANFSLPVLDRNGDEYIGLLELFEPLGAVSAKTNGKICATGVANARLRRSSARCSRSGRCGAIDITI